jgi:hypothetical protein
MIESKCLLSARILAHEFSDLMKKSRVCRVIRYYDIGSDSFKVLWWADGRAVEGANFTNHDLGMSLDEFSDRFVKPVVAAFEAGVAGEMQLAELERYERQLAPAWSCAIVKVPE